MHKQRKFFIGGLLFGLLGFIIFNSCLFVLSSLISISIPPKQIVTGALLLFPAFVASAGLVIWIGGRVLRRFGFETPYYYASFGLVLIWAIAKVVEVIIPMDIVIGAIGVFSRSGISVAAPMMNTLVLSLILIMPIGAAAFVIIAAVRKRMSRPTIWLIGIAVALSAVGSMLTTAFVRI